MKARRRLLTSAKFQFRYLRTILMIEVFVLIITAIVTMSIAFMLFSPELQIGPQWEDIVLTFMIEAIVVAGFLVYFGLRASHRLCGGVQRIVTDLEAIQRDEGPDGIAIRRGDEFGELVEAINHTLAHLRQTSHP